MEEDAIGLLASGCVMGVLLLGFIGFVTYSCITRNSRYKRRRTPRYRTSPVILPFASSSSQLSYESSRMILLDEERRKASKHSRHTNGVIGNKGPFQIQSSDLDPGYHIRMAQWSRRSYGEMSDKFEFEEESNVGDKASSTRRKSDGDTNNPTARTSVHDRTITNNDESEYVIIDYVDGNAVPDKKSDLTDMYHEIVRESKAWEDQEEEIVIKTVQITEIDNDRQRKAIKTVQITEIDNDRQRKAIKTVEITEVDNDRQRKASDTAIATEIKTNS